MLNKSINMQCLNCGKKYKRNVDAFKKHISWCGKQVPDVRIINKTVMPPNTIIIDNSIRAPQPNLNEIPKTRIISPQPNYSAPQPNYSAPQPNYSAPQPNYSAPLYPQGFYEGQVVRNRDNGEVSKLINGRVCWYPNPDIYQSWNSPPYTEFSNAQINQMPRGSNMDMNPDKCIIS
jgi:hypothetical protein